jgi:hypothetical protein
MADAAQRQIAEPNFMPAIPLFETFMFSTGFTHSFFL